jgi:hypothetical protein
MGVPEVEAFPTHLAENRGGAAVSRNQALNALMFLYRSVLNLPMEGIDAKREKAATGNPNHPAGHCWTTSDTKSWNASPASQR